MESKIEDEESATDVGEEEEEDEDDASFCLDGDAEEAGAPPPTAVANGGDIVAGGRRKGGGGGVTPSSVSRVSAKIRRLDLTDHDNEGDVGDDDFDRSPLVPPPGKRPPVDEGHLRSPSFAVVGRGRSLGGEAAPSRLFDDEPADHLDRRRTAEDKDDVSPRDVVGFPSFASFDSPSSSHVAKRVARGGSNFQPPPHSTARKTKTHHRRRILDNSNYFHDDNDDDDDMMISLDARSSSPPPPRGLRSFGRANSFMQMFGIGGGLGSSDVIVEGEEGIGGGDGGVGSGVFCDSSKMQNDAYDDFIRKPDGSVKKDDSGFVMSSPQRPIRNNNHRRYTPASPPDDDDDDDDDDDGGGGAPTSSFSRFVSDFEVVGTLGDGSFGSVYSVRNRTDRRMYAIKAAKREARGSSDRDRMLQEVFALSALSDKACVSSMHIVRYHQAWMEGNRLYIQTELCDGTLLGQMRGGVRIDEGGRYKLLREILLALDLVHKTGMIHLDIKPENIFIKDGHYKLGDFGLVSKIENHDDVEEGDSRYMSMELLLGELDDLTKVRNEKICSFCFIKKLTSISYVLLSTKSDIFSLGATMYEICLGRPDNLPENGQEWQDMRRGKLLPMPNTAIELQMIVRDMMALEWITRPSAESMLKRRQLLSDEQKQLFIERNKANVANMALDAQKVSMRREMEGLLL